MRFFHALMLMLAMIPAAVAAGDQGQMHMRLVLVDSCTIEVLDRAGPDPVHVDCLSGEPYAAEYGDHRVADRRMGDHHVEEHAADEPRLLTIAF